ncbi:MAG: maltotransferase domain-containing protein, partial [Pyrinomonadaceae bacterium]
MKQKERNSSHQVGRRLKAPAKNTSGYKRQAEIRREPSQKSEPADSRTRVVIEGVKPEIDCGRFAIKRVVGDRVSVEADVFTDGHDAFSVVLRYRREEAA